MLRLFLAFALLPAGFATAAIPAHASAIPPPAAHAAPSAAIPARRIKAAIHDYNGWLNQVARRNDVVGLATAVVVGPHVRYERTLGYADALTGARVEPTTVFRLASLSKAFATAMTGLLVQQGRLSWNSRLKSILPFFQLKDLQDTRDATVRDIAGQRLGLPRNSFDLRLEDGVPYNRLVRELDQITPICDVGSCYSYQNIAFSMLGNVVHAMTGGFFDREVAQHLFRPLGMTTASYGRGNLEHSRSWARPHRWRHGHWVPYQPKLDYYRVSPAAGVNASIRDMEQWLIAQMGYRPDVLSPALLKVLHAPGINTPSETWVTPWRRARVHRAHYALGWRVYDYAGHTMLFHAGAVQGYRAEIGFLPEYHIGLVILWNCTDPVPSGLLPMFFDRVLGLPHVDWARLNGRRRHRR
ncbi:MAG TPA: serine hydrolase domain-containing protein [Rhodanobacteraceae bacterium]